MRNLRKSYLGFLLIGLTIWIPLFGEIQGSSQNNHGHLTSLGRDFAGTQPLSSRVQVYLEAELGTVKVLHHTIQIGAGGTNFDYVNQGGQEILFPFQRIAAGIEFLDRHRIQFLYQPLTVVTNVRFLDDVIIDGITFESDSNMELTYGFPFYRLSYWFNFLSHGPWDFAIGPTVQLRNASIRFQQIGIGTTNPAGNDGGFTVSQNLGIVPALNLYTRYQFESGFSLALDLVGIYASSALINGANFEFEGSLLDASLRFGLPLRTNVESFLNVRFLGGSAKGTSQFDRTAWGNSRSAFTSNYLATLAVTLGATVR
jgi:hypothetical protein